MYNKKYGDYRAPDQEMLKEPHNYVDMPVIAMEELNGLPIVHDIVKEIELSPKYSQAFLMAFLACYGSVICKKVSVIHDGRKSSVNLFFGCFGAPGSGKSVAELALKVFEKTISYMKEVEDFSLILAANSSAAAFVKNLSKNGGLGLVFETEADTLSKTSSQDYAMMMDTFYRQIFHNESLRFSRKDLSITIENPMVSIVLLGTASQFQEIFKNHFNGLISRFLFHYFGESTKWKDSVFDYKQYKNSEESFSIGGDQILELYKFIQSTEHEFVFIWEEESQVILNENFEPLLDYHVKTYGADHSGIVFRLGLIASRIACNLTILRLFDSGRLQVLKPDTNPHLKPNQIGITATKEDLALTIKLVKSLFQHGITILDSFPKETLGKVEAADSRMLAMYEALPDPFNKSAETVQAIADQIGVRPRTVDYYLLKLTKNKLLEKGSNYRMNQFKKVKTKKEEHEN